MSEEKDCILGRCEYVSKLGCEGCKYFMTEEEIAILKRMHSTKGNKKLGEIRYDG